MQKMRSETAILLVIKKNNWRQSKRITLKPFKTPKIWNRGNLDLMEVTVFVEDFEGAASLNVSKRRRFDAVLMQF